MPDLETDRYPLAAGRYAGHSALLTGGANGLGFASARRLAAEGAAVGLIDTDVDALAGAVARLGEEGFEATPYVADVTDEARVKEAVADFAGRRGSIDVFVALAGIFPWIEFEDMTVSDWSRVIEINLTGVFICAHAVLPQMKRQRYGRIATISSGTFLYGTPGQSAYIASKAGLIGLTRVLAAEGGAAGITANTVLPGLMATDHVLSMRDDIDDLFELLIADQTVKRRGNPEDIADAVAYLCSEGAGFVSGQSLYVGGGGRFL